MVRPEVLKKRLDKIDECLALLEKMRAISRDQFVTTPEHYLSTERLLQLSIEATIDMGNHVIADLDLGHADWGSQIPDILAEKELISRDLAEIWIKMIGMRNILVHDYLEINHDTIYNVLQNHLKDIIALKEFFTRYT